MNLAVILPTTKLYGGVKRFFELGNIFIERGWRQDVFVPNGSPLDWFPFKGQIRPLNEIENQPYDAVFITESEFVSHALRMQAAVRIFYYVLEKPLLEEPLKNGFVVYANSSTIYHYCKRRYRIAPVKAFGGVDCSRFVPGSKKPGRLFTVMAFGRLNRSRKGTRLVVKACERLHRQYPQLRLLLFDTPVDENARRKISAFTTTVPFDFVVDHPVMETQKLYLRADAFVSAEKYAGWSNTSAEAMACGLPVIATTSGTTDFLIPEKTGIRVRRNSWSIAQAVSKLIRNRDLCAQLGQNGRKVIENFDWRRVADGIMQDLRQRCAARNTAAS